MNLRQYETCQRLALLDLMRQMNALHSTMGGRDSRPERIALLNAMKILQRELDRTMV